jgi:hypothetical protein
MNIKNLTPIKTFLESWKLMLKEKFSVPVPMLFDLVFIFAVGLVYSLFFFAMVDHLYAIMEFASKNTAALTEELMRTGSSVTSLLMGYEEFFVHFKALMLKVGLLLLSIYILWIIFKGINWKLCHKICKKDFPLLSFLKRFALVNIFWGIILTIISYIFFRIWMVNTMADVAPISPVLTTVLYVIFLILIFYFGMISYCLIPKMKTRALLKETFRLGFKKARIIVGGFLIAAIVFVIIDLLLRLAFIIWTPLMWILGIFILIPAFTWGRIYFILLINNLEKKK